MKMIKEQFSNINKISDESYKMILLKIICGFLFGMVLGMLISPKKKVTMGSNNSSTKNVYMGDREDEKELDED